MTLNVKNYRPTPAKLLKIAKKLLTKRVELIRSGKYIKQSYSKSTQARRRHFGLSASSVNLTGSNKYSRKGWRLLDSIKIQPKNKTSVAVLWTNREAAQIYSYQRIRYGELFRSF